MPLRFFFGLHILELDGRVYITCYATEISLISPKNDCAYFSSRVVILECYVKFANIFRAANIILAPN